MCVFFSSSGSHRIFICCGYPLARKCRGSRENPLCSGCHGKGAVRLGELCEDRHFFASAARFPTSIPEARLQAPAHKSGSVLKCRILPSLPTTPTEQLRNIPASSTKPRIMTPCAASSASTEWGVHALVNFIGVFDLGDILQQHDNLLAVQHSRQVHYIYHGSSFRICFSASFSVYFARLSDRLKCTAASVNGCSMSSTKPSRYFRYAVSRRSI